MWQWWFFTCICNWVPIFWFITKNVKNSKKSENKFQGTCGFFTIKHVSWQDYFLHMWPAFKARHLKSIEHKRGYVFVVQKNWNLLYEFMNSF